MNVLKILGIDKITPKIVVAGVGTLIWLGLSVNALYDLIKLFPTILATPAYWQVMISILIPGLFCVWIAFIYQKYKPTLTPSAFLTPPEKVMPHKGIILALSKPKTSSEDIIELIKNTDESKINVLYEERSIGQLFKGLYYHAETLQHVWLLTTDSSRDYKKCIEEFLIRFIPDAKVCDQDDNQNICHLTEETDLELIEQTKSALLHIYSKENLDALGLEDSDIITDISGGFKTITIGMIFSALDSTIDIQYVEQKNYEVIGLGITPEMILDKAGEYLLELYAKIRKEKQTPSCQ